MKFVEYLLSYELTTLDWVFAVLGAFLIGTSKTGVAGAGMIVVPLFAAIFGWLAFFGLILNSFSKSNKEKIIIFKQNSVKIGFFGIGLVIWFVIGYFYYRLIFFRKWLECVSEDLNITDYTRTLPDVWVLPKFNTIRPFPNIDITLAEGILLGLLLFLLIGSVGIIIKAWLNFKSEKNDLDFSRKHN